MKVFHSPNDKVNFVDKRNVFLGFDLGQDCCEHADYYISREPTKAYTYERDASKDLKDEDLEGYVFDKKFFERFDDNDGGGTAVFRATRRGQPDAFIHIFNFHNGYYGHGFEFKCGDLGIHGGTL